MTDAILRRPFRFGEIGGNTLLPGGEQYRTTHKSAVANYLYTIRQDGADRYGPTPGFTAKGADLVETGREAPVRGPIARYAGIELWKAMDEAAEAHCPNEAVAFHLIGSLPEKATPLQWRTIVQGFAQKHLASHGMVADWATHALADPEGGWIKLPHVHMIVTARSWRIGSGRRLGVRNSAWLGSPLRRRDLAEAWYDATGIRPSDYTTKAAA